MNFNDFDKRMQYKYIPTEILQECDFKKHKATSGNYYINFANQILDLSKLAKNEVLTMEKQMEIFDYLKKTLGSKKTIDPRLKIYKLNKSKEIYKLEMKQEDEDDYKYESEQNFDDLFRDYQKRYKYYRNNVYREPEIIEEKKEYDFLKTEDFYRKIDKIRKIRRKITNNQSTDKTKSTIVPTTQSMQTIPTTQQSTFSNSHRKGGTVKLVKLPDLNNEKIRFQKKYMTGQVVDRNKLSYISETERAEPLKTRGFTLFRTEKKKKLKEIKLEYLLNN